jgi:hypothetical protein
MDNNQSEKKGRTQTVQDQGVEKLRIQRAFWLSLLGLFLASILVVFLVLMGEFKAKTAGDITSVVGLFTTTLGTLVGAFFGLQIGSSGKEAAEKRADDSQKKAEALGAAATPQIIKKAQNLYPHLFK